MDKLKMQSNNLVNANVDKIAMLFPNCVTEGRVDFDLLRQELSNMLVEGKDERYRIEWVGKRQAILTANSPINKTLRPARAESVNFDTTENIYIEGDNLDVLKLLRETYLGKIKIIYIDPPYNTGTDLIYNDYFAEDANEYLLRSNQKDDFGNRLETNKDTSGRYHSDWLSMMYMRLKLARDLLTEDGAIFISIDDHEIDNLKRLCNEIFGESNYLGLIVRSTGTTTGQDANVLGSSLDYCLCYMKSGKFELGRMDLSDDDRKRFNQQDAKGYYSTLQLRKTGNADRREDRPNMYFEITAPNGEKVVPIGPSGYQSRWRVGKASFEELLKNDMIVWKEMDREYASGKAWIPYVKYYLEGRTKSPSNLWTDIDGNKKGSIELKDLLGEKNIFSNPKPTQFIKLIVNLVADNKNCIVLDFFSGSASTADAIMQMNAEDGGTRKFIMVQLDEKTGNKSEAYRAGYKTIPCIGKERIRRAGKKLASENRSIAPKLDIGFRVLKLDYSNMRDVFYNPKELDQSMLLDLENSIKEDRTAEDILFQVMLDRGISLSSKIEKRTIANGVQPYYIVGTDFGIIDLICVLDGTVNTEAVKEIAKLSSECVVFLDSGIASDATRTNIQQIFDTHSPKTKVVVL
ncbi:MAG: site-specific DNA-methyltransferase [Christensenellaceae bacterium]|jgi:adenine-specific DNA-methyltransferase|nr:site-specific DNA-methyltransferase [Christensenellaceae bacterium]